MTVILSKAKDLLVVSVRRTLLALGVALTSHTLPAVAAASDATTISFTTFSELRAHVLDAISGASKRIWLSTDYLTDGEIVSALYVARYRKLDVQVLLGRAKSNFYMSRLAYLKNQNIPVFLKPPTFKGDPTALLVDAVLIRLDSDLDFMSKANRFEARVALQDDAQAYAQSFAAAVDQKVPAVPHQIPAVGRPGRYNNAYVPANSPRPTTGGTTSSNNYKLPIPSGRSGAADASGAYTYDRVKAPKPDDVPAALPKATIWQKRAQDAANTPAATP